jgi:hypothetical protein
MTGQGMAAARDGWVTTWQTVRWDWWLRFAWRQPGITEATALEHLDQLRRRLHRESHGTAFVTGLHRDPMLHAHGLWKLSRRQRPHILNATEAQAVLELRWPHGEVWCDRFDGERYDPRGSIAYVGRHPDTVTW